MTMKHRGTTTRTVTKTRARVRELTKEEEKVLRMRQGVAVDDDAPLEAKTNNPELLAKLRDIEAEFFLRAGQIEPISKKQRIIDKLKRR